MRMVLLSETSRQFWHMAVLSAASEQIFNPSKSIPPEQMSVVGQSYSQQGPQIADYQLSGNLPFGPQMLSVVRFLLSIRSVLHSVDASQKAPRLDWGDGLASAQDDGFSLTGRHLELKKSS